MAKKLGRGLEGLFRESEPTFIADTPIPTEPSRPAAPPPPAVTEKPVPAKVAINPAPVAPPAPVVSQPAPVVAPAPIQPLTTWSGFVSTDSPAAPATPSAQPAKSVAAQGAADGSALSIRTDQLIPNRFQPRKTFDRAALTELMDSIKTAGLLQPILVRQSGSYYEIVAGERRWRACVELKVPTVPVIIKEVNDQQMLEWALIENTQRKDLNPIERARAYKELMTFFNLTQEEIARRVGLDRATVANFIRLLDLPNEVQDEVAKETISTTHARSLLAINEPLLQIKLAHRIRKQGLSVRRLEYIIKWLKHRRELAQSGADGAATTSARQIQLREIEDKLMRKFNTKTIISTLDNKQGKIIISFYSLDDFQRILDKLEQIK